MAESSNSGTDPRSPQLHVLGPPVLIDACGSVVQSLRRKDLALLVYLMLAPQRRHLRGTLSGLLWADAPSSDDARHSLGQALGRLQRVLPEGTLRRGADEIDLANPIPSDAARLEEIDRSGSGDSSDLPLSVYAGDFVSGFAPGPGSQEFELWADARRSEYRNTALRILERWSAAAERAGDWDRVLALANRMIEVDALAEHAHRHVMAALAAMGERARALRHYETVRALFAQGAGLEPSTETQALARQIRDSGQPQQRRSAAPPQQSSPTSTDDTLTDSPVVPATAVELAPAESNAASRRPPHGWPLMISAALVVVLVAAVTVRLGTRHAHASALSVTSSAGALPVAVVHGGDPQSQAPIPCIPVAAFVSEEYPDDTPVPAGTHFVKSWTVRNTGKCSWGGNYYLRYESSRGPRLSGPTKRFYLQSPVRPGEVHTFTVAMTAPETPGAYREDWSLRDSSGAYVQVSSSNTVWARIVVPSPRAELCTASDAVVKFVKEAYPDNTPVPAGSRFTKSWTLRNGGMCTWSQFMFLRYVSSPQGLLSQSQADVRLGADVPPGGTFSLSVPMRAPDAPGTYREDWQLFDGRGGEVRVSGSRTIWAQIVVKPQ